MIRLSPSFTVAVLIALLTSAAGKTAESSKSKTKDDYWRESSITLPKFTPEIFGCYKEESRFIGCIEYFNVLAGAGKSSVTLIPDDPSVARLIDVKKRVVSFGPLVLVEVNKNESEEPATNLWKKSVEIRDAKIGALRKIFSHRARKVDFKKMSQYILKRIPADIFAKDEKVLAVRALNAYFISSDPHAHLEPVEELRAQAQSKGDEFSGIGAHLRLLKDQTVIEKLIEGGGALEAGLRTGDVITNVNGKSVKGLPLDEIVDLIRGPEKTVVNLDIVRRQQNISIAVQRKRIINLNVTVKMLDDRGLRVGYIRLNSFMHKTACESVAEGIGQLEGEGANALIFDMRGNGGGLLDQAVCIGGLFVGERLIVKAKDLQSGLWEKLTSRQTQVTNLPMLTLIDSGSASASEIVAGALQDYQRSWIAGDRSFGKATVQRGDLYQDFSDVMIFHTIARFYQPSGRTNQVVGILPDFSFDPVPNATEEDRFAPREADYYLNALPPVGEPWVQPRPQEVTRILKCAKETGSAERSYNDRSNDPILPDFQLLSAQDILACAI